MSASNTPANGETLVSIRDLKMHFPIYKGLIFRQVKAVVKAVDGISLDIKKGETLGLVGESGCGKSTTGRSILRLYEPGIGKLSGQVLYGGQDLVKLPHSKLRPLRKELQIIFQDPYASLNPRMTVQTMITEPLKLHGIAKGDAATERVKELMDIVGLSPAMLKRYPHEFSGGQRQRIGIARALAVSPKFIVCDEPISALDVSIQAQVMNLMQDLQQQFDLTYLFIAHDLAAVRHISDRVAVMYLGKLVELAPSAEIYAKPTHPYTQALISAVPIPDPVAERSRNRILLEGDVPSPLKPPSGCRFHTRCQFVEAICKTDDPELKELSPGHFVACHVAARGDIVIPNFKTAASARAETQARETAAADAAEVSSSKDASQETASDAPQDVAEASTQAPPSASPEDDVEDTVSGTEPDPEDVAAPSKPKLSGAAAAAATAAAAAAAAAASLSTPKVVTPNDVMAAESGDAEGADDDGEEFGFGD